MRIKRITERDGITEEMAKSRLKIQLPDSFFIENCDYSLYNDGEQADFTERFKKLLKEIRHE